GENSAVGHGIAKEIRRQISFPGHHPEEFIVGFHHKILDELAFLRRDWPGAVEHVFKLAAFEYHRSESDFVEQLLVIERLNNHADAAGDRGVAGHEKFPAARDIITARGGQRLHVNDDRFAGTRLEQSAVDGVGGGYFSAW